MPANPLLHPDSVKASAHVEVTCDRCGTSARYEEDGLALGVLTTAVRAFTLRGWRTIPPGKRDPGPPVILCPTCAAQG